MSKTLRWILGIVGVLAAVAILGSVIGGKPDVTPAGTTIENVTQTPNTSVSPAPAKETAKAVKMTLSQEQAFHKAEDYLRFMAFSRQQLIGQLEFDKFSRKDAVFAVDHVEVNWNDQAAKKAENYLQLSHYSKPGLVNQLIVGDHFTKAQATHGADEAYNSAG
jgi:hypothetical protein